MSDLLPKHMYERLKLKSQVPKTSILHFQRERNEKFLEAVCDAHIDFNITYLSCLSIDPHAQLSAITTAATAPQLINLSDYIRVSALHSQRSWGRQVI